MFFSPQDDPLYSPPTPNHSFLDTVEYQIVSSSALRLLFENCQHCKEGKNSISEKQSALGLKVSTHCNSCGYDFEWTNSSVVPSASDHNKDQLSKINLDAVLASTLTGIGHRVSYFLKRIQLRDLHETYTIFQRSNEYLSTLGLPTINETSYLSHKKNYVAPAVDDQWKGVQAELVKKLKEKIAKVRDTLPHHSFVEPSN